MKLTVDNTKESVYTRYIKWKKGITMAINLTFFEQTQSQRIVSAFGRKMMWASESGEYMNIPLEILNQFSRIGEEMAETGSMDNLSTLDKKVIKYAKAKING